MSSPDRRSGIAVLAVTRQGTRLGADIVAALRSVYGEGPELTTSLHVKSSWRDEAPAGAETFDGSLADRVKTLFPEVQTLVFVLAVGATVRLVAPLLGRKQDDPGVICVDDAGQFVIPVLGGHQASANRDAELIADAIGARAIVTTASEGAGLPNLDRLGETRRWKVEAVPDTLKRAAAALLAGEEPAVYLQFGRTAGGAEIRPSWPRVDSVDGLRGWPGPRIAVTDLLIEPSIVADGGPLLVYRPPSLTLGIGCSTDAPAEEVEALARAALDGAGLAFGSVDVVATIDRRVDHPAILHLARLTCAGRNAISADVLASVKDLPSPSAEVLRHVGTPGVCEPAAIIGSGNGTLIVPKRKSARSTVAVARNRWADGERLATIRLVGIGPGPLDLMTPRARRAIRDADAVIGYRAYLDQIADISPERCRQPYELGQERERAAEAIRRAREGYDVALVSSGDIGIYGMAGLVFELLEEMPDVDGKEAPLIEVIPGVTAATSAGALLGAPLMLDFAAISLSDLLVPWDSIQRRLTAAAEGDLVVVLYNPASARRRRPFEEALVILRQHRPPETPVGLVREAYRPEQQVTVTTLGDLPAEQVDMRTVVVIGCSGTANLGGRLVTRRGYLERSEG